MISVALALRACSNGGSLSLKRERKKGTKEKGVIERILHFRAPKMRTSILCTVWGSKMKPSFPCFRRVSKLS